MGFNAQWGQPWGTNHPGPWVKDPRPWLNAILNGSGGAPNTTDTSGAPLPNCGVDPICLLNNWWISSVGPTLKIWGEYIGIFLIAIVLIVIGFVLLNEKDGDVLAPHLEGWPHRTYPPVVQQANGVNPAVW